MLAEPDRKFVFGHLARGDREHGEDAVRIARHKLPAIESQKKLDGDKGSAFVAVDKGKIAGDAAAICGGKRAGIRFGVRDKIQLPGEGGLKQRRVAQTCAAAVFSQLHFVYSDQHCMV